MDPTIINLANNIYQIAQTAELTSDEFGKVFDQKTLEEISEELNKDKQTFLNSNQDLPSANSLWETGYQSAVQKKLAWHLIYVAIDNNKGMSLDWKFSAEDVVYNIKSILPNFDIISTGESQVDGEWIESVKINRISYDFDQKPGEMIDEIIQKVNQHLPSQTHAFVGSDFSDDNHYFLYVNKKSLPALNSLGFTPI